MNAVQDLMIVGLGELLWDCFSDSRRPGGAPANVAFHVQQLGTQGIIASRVGSDQLGDELIQFLEEKGLETSFIQWDKEHPTGTVTVDDSIPRNPDFQIHENTAWDFLEYDDQLRKLMQKADAVCFGTLAQRTFRARNTIRRALSAVSSECLLVYDINIRQNWYHRAWIEDSLNRAHIAKLNSSEVELLTELLKTETTNHLDFAQQLLSRYDVDQVCITRGEQGCLLLVSDQLVDLPGLKTDVKDTVGAGDAFTAALIFSRLTGRPLEDIARFANEVGTLVASREGAMPSIEDELQELIRQYGQQSDGDAKE